MQGKQVDTKRLQVQGGWEGRGAEGSRTRGKGWEESLGWGIEVREDGMGRSCDGLGPCACFESVRWNSAPLWAAFTIRLWTTSGMSSSSASFQYTRSRIVRHWRSVVNRPHLSWQRKREAHWTFHTHTWRATPSVEIRKAELPKMILRLRQTCKQLGTWAMMETMRRTFAMSLRFNRFKWLPWRK